MARLGLGLTAGAAALLLLAGAVARPSDGTPAALEVVATGVPRPLQLALDGQTLIVLSPGARGDVAGELYRVDLRAELPVDLSRQPRVRIPFADARTATLGSLAVEPRTRELFLGEENGTRIYRLTLDEGLTLHATGLHRLAGGGTLAFDEAGRLLVADYTEPNVAPGEDKGPSGLEPLREDEYRGPLVFRLTLDPAIPEPRRLERVPPLFPRGWRAKGPSLVPRMISVAPVGRDIALLATTGELFRLTSDGALVSLAWLPPGHGMYNRTHVVVAPDGSLFVSGGFHVGKIFRVRGDGAVSTVVSNLGDPEGIALDTDGSLYVAESSFHRVVRLRP
jgi:hypothetical protein